MRGRSLTVGSTKFGKSKSSVNNREHSIASSKEVNIDLDSNHPLANYMKIKQRLNKKKRLFNDDKIASLDEETENRTSLVAKLLGRSKEALDI